MIRDLRIVASLAVFAVLLRTPVAIAGSLLQASPETMKYVIPYDCGDGVCSGFDECSTCPEDCGFCEPVYCGDGICQSEESCSTCPGDCGECSEDRSVVVYGADGTAKRFWADYAGNAILRSNLDGSQVEVARYASGPYGISYDPGTESLLWTSSTDEVVQAAPADGSGTPITLESAFDEDGAAIVVVEEDVQLAYGIADSQIIKITQNHTTGDEQREVLVQLSSPDAVVGLALTADRTTLYFGDTVGRMSQKLNLASGAVEPLVFDDGTQPLPLTAAARRLSICPAPAFLEVAR
ncbi:MAG TPA: hypothetical protein VGX68_01055 [Thermoanaerobaculia bacterium]|jgi:hypothetical protein|nr:hypothetical protein [Thermoanaerobaculia bacterium]